MLSTCALAPFASAIRSWVAEPLKYATFVPSGDQDAVRPSANAVTASVERSTSVIVLPLSNESWEPSALEAALTYELLARVGDGARQVGAVRVGEQTPLGRRRTASERELRAVGRPARVEKPPLLGPGEATSRKPVPSSFIVQTSIRLPGCCVEKATRRPRGHSRRARGCPRRRCCPAAVEKRCESDVASSAPSTPGGRQRRRALEQQRGGAGDVRRRGRRAVEAAARSGAGVRAVGRASRRRRARARSGFDAAVDRRARAS